MMTLDQGARRRHRLDIDDVGIRRRVQVVGSVRQGDRVAGGPTVDLVMADEADDRVVAGACQDDVGSRGTGDGVAQAGADDGEAFELLVQVDDDGARGERRRHRLDIDDVGRRRPR